MTSPEGGFQDVGKRRVRVVKCDPRDSELAYVMARHLVESMRGVGHGRVRMGHSCLQAVENWHGKNFLRHLEVFEEYKAPAKGTDQAHFEIGVLPVTIVRNSRYHNWVRDHGRVLILRREGRVMHEGNV